MGKQQWSNYEKYLVICNDTTKLSATYSAYMEFKELMTVLKKISTSGSGQYMFKGKQYVSPISSQTAIQAVDDLENARFNGSILGLARDMKLLIF